MEKFKVEIKEPKLSDEEILKRQDFNTIVNNVEATKRKSKLIKQITLGVIGLASVTSIAFISFSEDNIPIKGNNTSSIVQQEPNEQTSPPTTSKEQQKNAKENTPIAPSKTDIAQTATKPKEISITKSSEQEDTAAHLNLGLTEESEQKLATFYLAGLKQPRSVNKRKLVTDIELFAKEEHLEEPLKITSYKLSITKKNGEIEQFDGKGSQLTPEMIRAIHTTNKGDELYFYEVLSKDGEGRVHKTKAFKTQIFVPLSVINN